MKESYTLSGVPRSVVMEQSSPASVSAVSPQRSLRPSPPPQQPRRPAPSPPVARAPVFVTEIRPRAVQLRLDGLRLLLVGSEPAVVEVERRALEAAGATVVIESNWNNAITRMTSEGVHGIVLNEDSSGQTRRLYQSLAQEYPGWMRRLLLVLAKDDILTIQFMSTCEAKCLLRPFQSAELLAVVAKMFGMASESAGSGAGA
jgi:CheY-like chemotaxis protein